MKGIKNAVVVTLMMGVLYAVYVTLSKPDPPLPKDFTAADVAALAPPQVDFGGSQNPIPADTVAVVPPPPRTFAANNTAPRLADNSRAPRGGSFLADKSAPEVSAPQLEPPADIPAVENPANVEVPVLPPIPAAEPTPAERPERKQSVYGGATGSTAENSPANSATANSEVPKAASNPALTLYSLKQDWQRAEQAVQTGKFAEALALLSKYYNHADLSQADQQQVAKWLDALAGKVVYSPEHILAEPHKVSSGETLFDVAERHSVPWQLLQNINGVRDPEVLVPGTTLKVVPGPFRAEVDLTRGELTLFLNEMYAGRFPFALGDEPPQPGEYRVGDKRRDRVYVGQGQRVVNGTDPDNPYGGWWLDLGREASIHGSPKSGAGPTLGCVGLSPQDAKDVYGILSLGSTVTIKR